MPFYRKPRARTPPLFAAERRAVKNGVHRAVFTPRLGRYVGDWRNDKKEGKGHFLTIGGKLYEGDWLNGFRHGFGTLSQRLPSGAFALEYRGEWRRGRAHGAGWGYYPAGDVYCGGWRRGARHGYGKMWYRDGGYYVGYWRDGRREGLGMLVHADGNRYEGNWASDLKSGRGRFYHTRTGQLQDGVWRAGLCVMSKMADIAIRQCCELPTTFPIPKQELLDAKSVLEESDLWMQQRLGDLDKQLKACVGKN